MNNMSWLRGVLALVVVVGGLLYNQYFRGPAAPGPSLPDERRLPEQPRRNEPEAPADEGPRRHERPSRPETPSSDSGFDDRRSRRDPAPGDAAQRHDLEHDEKMGGHTLRKHVGRSDEQLRERLAQEHISSASTFTDREAAEMTVGAALAKHAEQIKTWLSREGHDPKFAFIYEGDPGRPIGRSVKRGANESRPCHKANIVLASRGDGFFVLTAYPEL